MSSSRYQHLTKADDLLINSSAIHDRNRYVPALSNSTSLTNNYAPLRQQLTDSLLKRNTHPLARYVEEIPIYDGLFSALPMSDLAMKQSEQYKLKGQEIVNSHVLLQKPTNAKPIEVITPIDASGDGVPQLQRWLNNKSTLEKAVWGSSKLNERYGKPETNAPVSIRRIRFRHREQEAFERKSGDTYLDQVYIQSLESRLIAVVHYVNDNPIYEPWKQNWEALRKSMERVNYSFSRLPESDADVAYTMNKGEATRFRIRDKDMKYVPLNIYQYVLYHEAAHCANEGNWGHGKEFCRLLSILCLAAYELGFVDARHMQKSIYTTNGQPVLCKSDMKKEILNGIAEMVETYSKKGRTDIVDHYRRLAMHIERV